MRSALSPRAHHNPDVEPERPGFCLHNRAHGWWWNATRGWMAGRESATIYGRREDADRACSYIAGSVVTSVPRFNGHVVEWSEVA